MSFLAPETVADIVAHGWRDCGIQESYGDAFKQHAFDDDDRCLHLYVVKDKAGSVYARVCASYYHVGGIGKYQRMPALHKNVDAVAEAASRLADELQFLVGHGIALRTAQLRHRFRRSTALETVPLKPTRTCLCCSKPFASAGPHNRVCTTCRTSTPNPTWRAAA